MDWSSICDVQRDLVPYVQFEKREIYPWRSVTFTIKVTFLHGCFSRFSSCTNDTKSRKASHISHSSHYPHIICQFLFNSDTICSKNGVQRRGFAFQRISVSLVTISIGSILLEFFKVITLFNLFHVTDIFMCLLKISEIQRFSVFKGYINRPSGMEWVKGPCWSSRPSAFYSWSHDPILKLYWI